MTEITIECDRLGSKWLVSGDLEWQLRSYEMMALCPDVVACLITPSEIYRRAVRSVSDRFVQYGNWFDIDFRIPLLRRVS
jgi:hypothetical protein